MYTLLFFAAIYTYYPVPFNFSHFDVTASSEDSSHRAPLLIDEDEGTYWSAASGVTSAVLYFDFGQNLKVQTIGIFPRSGGTGFISHVDIFTSDSLENLQSVSENDENRVDYGDMRYSEGKISFYNLESVLDTRYLGLKVESESSVPSCNELYFYPEPVYSEQDRKNWDVVANSEQTENDQLAIKSIDYDTTSFWHSDWETESDMYYLKFDASRPITFDSFIYTPRGLNNNGTYHPNGRFEDYKFYILNSYEQDLSDAQIVSQVDSNWYDPTNYSDVSTRTVKLNQEYQTQYFAISTTGSPNDGSRRFGTCAEFQVYRGIDVENSRLERDSTNPWTATANSFYNNNDSTQGPPEYAIDGDTSTFWVTDWDGGVDIDKNHGYNETTQFYLIVDLKEIRYFKSYSYLPRQDSPQRYVHKCAFYSSLSNTNEEIIQKILNREYDTIHTFKHSSYIKHANLPRRISARFVAIQTLVYDTRPSCAEFDLYSEFIPNASPVEDTKLSEYELCTRCSFIDNVYTCVPC